MSNRATLTDEERMQIAMLLQRVEPTEALGIAAAGVIIALMTLGPRDDRDARLLAAARAYSTAFEEFNRTAGAQS